MTVLAASGWTTNAHMIEACAELDYVKPTDLILDPTYGRGVWWRRWQPTEQVGGRLDRADLLGEYLTDEGTLWTRDTPFVVSPPTVVGADFRSLPWEDDEYDVVAFDPPYVSTGGRETSTIPDFNARFGLHDAPRTPEALQNMNADGLEECMRVVKPGGIVLAKAMPYVSSGKLWLGDYNLTFWAHELGFEVQDRLIHLGRPRPQPQRTRRDGQPVRQQHARSNYSVLLVLRAPR